MTPRSAVDQVDLIEFKAAVLLTLVLCWASVSDVGSTSHQCLANTLCSYPEPLRPAWKQNGVKDTSMSRQSPAGRGLVLSHNWYSGQNGHTFRKQHISLGNPGETVCAIYSIFPFHSNSIWWHNDCLMLDQRRRGWANSKHGKLLVQCLKKPNTHTSLYVHVQYNYTCMYSCLHVMWNMKVKLSEVLILIFLLEKYMGRGVYLFFLPVV